MPCYWAVTVKLAISPEILEDLVTIEAQAMSEQITQLVAYVQNLDKQTSRLTVKKGEQVYLLEHEEIVRLYLEDRLLQVETVENVYTSNLRLYQVKEDLPANFLQISQSEIIHIKQLDHLKLTSNGLVKLVMKNGSVTYSSRRYLKVIKERLGL
ncbi:LytTR family transcriptional regulator [Streptococcus suis]|nr:LytTR family transcriptional regulator [Streptococcus suis]